MRISCSIFLFAVFSILFTFCQFEPEGEMFKEVSQRIESDYDGVSIYLDNVTDQIVVARPLYINLLAETKNLTVKYVQISLGEEQIGISSSSNRELPFIKLDPSRYEDGEYELKLIMTTTSGSNSLADNVGQESYTIEKKYSVLITKKKPEPIEISNAEIHNGLLRLNFNNPDSILTKKMTLKKLSLGSGRVIREYDISDFGSEYFYDSAYCGGDFKYKVDVETYYHDVFGTESDTIGFDPEVEFDVSWTQGHKLKFSWAKPVFYNSDIRFEVNYRGKFSIRADEAGEYISEEDSSELEFGRHLPVELVALPNVRSSYDPYESSTIARDTFLIGSVIEPFNLITYSPDLDSYFTCDFDGVSNELTIQKRESNTLQVIVENKISYLSTPTLATLKVSTNGQYLYLYHGNTERVLQVIDPTDLSVIDVAFPSSQLKNVSNQNILALGNYIYDAEEGNVIFYKDGGSWLADISPNAKYFTQARNLYKINADKSVELIRSFDDMSLELIKFSQFDDNILYIGQNYVSSFEAMKKYHIEEEEFERLTYFGSSWAPPFFDDNENYFWTKDTNKVTFIDKTNGAKRTQVISRYLPGQYPKQSDIQIINGKMLSSAGYFINLK